MCYYDNSLYVNPIEFNFLDISMSLAFFPKSLQNKFGFCLGSQRQLPKRNNTLYLWPRSKGWMRAHERTFNLQRLKSQIYLFLVCIPSSRQLKKYKIFVLPGWISGNIFMPPIVAFHEIPLVLRLQVLSVAGRLYSNLYIL